MTLPASLTAIGEDAFKTYGDITFTVPSDSWAAQWCRDNGLRFTYSDAKD